MKKNIKEINALTQITLLNAFQEKAIKGGDDFQPYYVVKNPAK